MTVDARLFTAEELLRLPDDGSRYELVEGELNKISPAGYDHGDIAMNIGAHLKAYVRAHRLGKVFAAETGFLLSRNPDTVLAPDVSYVRTARLMRPRGRGYFVGYLRAMIDVLEVDDVVPGWKMPLTEVFEE